VRIRVTCITAEEVGSLVGEVALKFQDWLGAALSDGEFGGRLDQVTMFIVSVDDDVGENARWTRPRNGLGRVKNPFTGETFSNLSLAVAIPPSKFAQTTLKEALAVASSAFSERILERPRRVPKGFEYERFAKGLSTALGAYTA
jgi:hypothetical protein